MLEDSTEPDCKLFDELKNIQLQLSNLDHQQRFHLALSNIEAIKDNILNSQNCVVSIMDNTTAGGTHQVKLFFDIKNNLVYLEVPDIKTPLNKNAVKSGEYPTILHAIEIVTVAYKKANKQYPKLKFGLSSEDFLQSTIPTEDLKPILIPLTIDPEYTNAIIFHTQIRKINPEHFAISWYEFYKNDPNLLITPIRHTILLMPLSNTDESKNINFEFDQPKSKNTVNVAYLQKEIAEDKKRFRTLYLGRISRWENFELNSGEYLPQITKNEKIGIQQLISNIDLDF